MSRREEGNKFVRVGIANAFLDFARLFVPRSYPFAAIHYHHRLVLAMHLDYGQLGEREKNKKSALFAEEGKVWTCSCGGKRSRDAEFLALIVRQLQHQGTSPWRHGDSKPSPPPDQQWEPHELFVPMFSSASRRANDDTTEGRSVWVSSANPPLKPPLGYPFIHWLDDTVVVRALVFQINRLLFLIFPLWNLYLNKARP